MAGLVIEVRVALGDALEAAAELMVSVDAAYGSEPWWSAVRAEGVGAARELLDLDWHQVALAWAGDRLVGFAGLDRPEGREVEIARIMTRPGHEGHGVARGCIGALVEVADREGLTVWLVVLAHAQRAIALYEHLGFVRFGAGVGSRSHRPTIQMRRPHPQDQVVLGRLASPPSRRREAPSSMG